MLSTSNWRLTPGRRDGSSFRQIRAAMKHRISIPSVSGLPTPHMINTWCARENVSSLPFAISVVNLRRQFAEIIARERTLDSLKIPTESQDFNRSSKGEKERKREKKS